MADTGYNIHAQNNGLVVHEDVLEHRPRGHQRWSREYRNPNARRQTWDRARELAVRLQREHEAGFVWTWLRIERFTPAGSREVFYAAPGSDNWKKLLAPIAA